MCQYSSVDGFANDWHLVHLGSRAVGGAGLVFMEATAVEARGRISPQRPGDLEGRARRVSDADRRASSQRRARSPGIQLAHAGRKASTRAPWEGGGFIPEAEGGWRPVGAEPDRRSTPEDPAPHARSTTARFATMVDGLRGGGAAGAGAGFEVVEIHAAHGYLAHEFLSPLEQRAHRRVRRQLREPRRASRWR